MWYDGAMKAKALKDVLQRVVAWPEEAQEELAEIAWEIEAGLGGGVYHAGPDELPELLGPAPHRLASPMSHIHLDRHVEADRCQASEGNLRGTASRRGHQRTARTFVPLFAGLTAEPHLHEPLPAWEAQIF